MKKRSKIIGALFSDAMLFSMAVLVTDFAAEEEIVQKDVTAYVYSKEKTNPLDVFSKS